MSSEGKRWTMRYEGYNEVRIDPPLEPDDEIEVAPATEVERLKEALRDCRVRFDERGKIVEELEASRKRAHEDRRIAEAEVERLQRALRRIAEPQKPGEQTVAEYLIQAKGIARAALHPDEEPSVTQPNPAEPTKHGTGCPLHGSHDDFYENPKPGEHPDYPRRCDCGADQARAWPHQPNPAEERWTPEQVEAYWRFGAGYWRAECEAKRVTLTICRRSGQVSVDCGLSACEYGCDAHEADFYPAAEVERLERELREAHEGDGSPCLCRYDGDGNLIGSACYHHQLERAEVERLERERDELQEWADLCVPGEWWRIEESRADKAEAEVERLREAIDRHTTWTIGATVHQGNRDEWTRDQELRAAQPAPDSEGSDG